MADDDDARELHNSLWSINTWARHSPSPTPMSLGREDIETIRHGYVVTPKTDGERCSLVLGFHRDDPSRTYAYRFNRASVATRIAITSVGPVHLPEDPQADPLEGSLLDCEYMASARSLVLLDCVAACGYDMKDVEDIEERLRVGALVAAAIKLQGITITTKPFVPVTTIAAIDVDAAGTDGLIFMPRRHPVQRGRGTHLFKWKRRHHQTIDGQLVDGVFLFGDDDSFVSGEALGIHVLPTRLTLREGSIYELGPDQGCHRDDDDDEVGAVHEYHFTVLHERRDKTAPNQKDTVLAALRHIRENITHGELLGWFSSPTEASPIDARAGACL